MNEDHPKGLSVIPNNLVSAVAPLVLALILAYLSLRVVWVASDFFLLTGAGALAAFALNRVADMVHRKFGLPQRAGVVLLLLLLSGAFAFFLYIAGAQVSEQLSELAKDIPSSAQALREQVLETRWGRTLESYFPGLSAESGKAQGGGGGGSKILGSFQSLLGSIAGFLTAFLFLLAVTLYLSVDPGLYIDGFVKLLKRDPRKRRARRFFSALSDRMWNFLKAQFSEMTIVGVLTGVGLALLGIPYALALGLVAGIICFIPVIGPVLSFIPAILVAFTEGGDAAMKVTALYVGIQLVETNLITPVIQKKLADIPPVLLILTQAVTSVVFGLIGVALAAPGLVVAMALIEELYLPEEDEPPHEIEVATVVQESSGSTGDSPT